MHATTRENNISQVRATNKVDDDVTDVTAKYPFGQSLADKRSVTKQNDTFITTMELRTKQNAYQSDCRRNQKKEERDKIRNEPNTCTEGKSKTNVTVQ